MIILRFIAKIIQVLRAGPSPSQIAGGFVLGMFLGMMPLANLFSLVIVLLIFVLNVNISAAILGWMAFTLFSYFLDPVFHNLGYALLANNELLKNLFTWFYNRPVIPLSKFNNTVVFGSFIFSIILASPVYFSFKKAVVLYRSTIDKRIRNLKIVHAVQSNRAYLYYRKIRNLGD